VKLVSERAKPFGGSVIEAIGGDGDEALH